MCLCLDKRPFEYTVNFIDIATDFFFAYWIYPTCWGWTVGIIVTSFLGIIGVIAKMIAQCYKKETINPQTNLKEIEWTTQFVTEFETPYLFGILFEETFEGLFVGIMEALIIGEAMDIVGIVKIIIKAIYFTYMNFKYCKLSHQDHFKPWLITLTLTMSIIWYGCAISTMFGIVKNTPVAECV